MSRLAPLLVRKTDREVGRISSLDVLVLQQRSCSLESTEYVGSVSGRSSPDDAPRHRRNVARSQRSATLHFRYRFPQSTHSRRWAAVPAGQQLADPADGTRSMVGRDGSALVDDLAAAFVFHLRFDRRGDRRAELALEEPQRQIDPRGHAPAVSTSPSSTTRASTTSPAAASRSSVATR